ncbi:MAG: pyruvate formate-lyase-activating protein [Alphaproteobacteria bacterium]|nr:pyruvate formate-lyase-activating protein [Alphaproteobacteria bacterium]
MPNTQEGYIHSVETAGTVDGPGMRFVVFVSGCPMRCLYCHNPDTRNMKDGKLTRAKDLVAEIMEYSDFIKRTGGGVTISGGEPLFQQKFVTAILKGCKEHGLHTAVDTSGYLGKMIKQELLDLTDLFLLDIKSFDPATHEKVTGKKLAPTLDFARHLAAIGKPMWVRCVIVPNLTDDLDVLGKLADFLKELGNVEKVEVLPFHKMGEAKWEALGLTYQLKNTQPPSPDLIQHIHEIFAARGLSVV